MDPA